MSAEEVLKARYDQVSKWHAEAEFDRHRLQQERDEALSALRASLWLFGEYTERVHTKIRTPEACPDARCGITLGRSDHRDGCRYEKLLRKAGFRS